MWRLLILSALSGLILADQQAESGSLFGRLFGDVLDPRLAANALNIGKLAQKLQRLREKVHEAEKIDPEGFIHELDARVSALEGTHCDDRAFQCGGNEQECVSDVLVCDGHKDCHNGHDEDSTVCDTSAVKAGNVFSGTSHWTDCRIHSDHVTRIIITGTSRRKFFQSRIWVRARIESDLHDKGHNETHAFNTKGYFNFAKRRLALVPADDSDHHLGVVCDFNHGDNERAECHRILEATLHTCANLFVTLEHKEH